MEFIHTEEKPYSTEDFDSENNELITIYPDWFKSLPNYLIVGKVVAYLQMISRDISDFLEIGNTRRYMNKHTKEYSSELVCKIRSLIETGCYNDRSIIPENEMKICQTAIEVIINWENERGNHEKYNSYSFEREEYME